MFRTRESKGKSTNGSPTNQDEGGLAKKGVITVEHLLQQKKLTIPNYQRPYKWTAKNVNQLLDDIYHHRQKSRYRLGTIVIHDDGDYWNIVDGQQRTITFQLIVQAIINIKIDEIKSPDLQDRYRVLEQSMIDPSFGNDISIANIQRNYHHIERKVAGFDEETIAFVIGNCELIQFVLTDISEAFQFFDSQNARGKELEPHDLLKAYHLREFSEEYEDQKKDVVKTWEQMETSELSNLFGEYLYRIKGWSKGNSARYFTKDEVDMFKGINVERVEHYPYTKMLRIAHHYVDDYNSSYKRRIDKQEFDYPFQIDQPIINGRRFFEFVGHYKKVLDSFLNSKDVSDQLNETASGILETIDDYEGKHRTGDGYIRMLFDCALMYYIDKFGFKDISKAIERIFIWAYKLRLRHQAVQLASVDNYVIYETNFFNAIRDATNPSDVLSVYLEPLEEEKIGSTKTDRIKDKFEELRYVK